MATHLSAMRGQFGSTEYFVILMTANELRSQLVIPNETDDWEDLSIEDRYQREVDYKRVAQHIAPYLANDPDRFFGAFIVDVRNPGEMEFESIGNIGKIPALYNDAAKKLGVLSLSGSEVLVPLDGQHRLAAIKFALSGKDEKNKIIPGMNANTDVGADLCTVILIKHDTRKARKIFNKINRYAKSTSKADNLITADDDPIAVIVRHDIVDGILNQRIVNYESNTLSPKAQEFTTLSSVYEATATYVESIHGKVDRTKLPSPADMTLYRNDAIELWRTLLEGIAVFEMSLMDHSEAGDDKRREVRSTYVLGKPIVQQALVDAITRLRTPRPDATRLVFKDILELINKVDWTVGNPLWQGIIMNQDKVVTGGAAAKFAARFIAYYLGEPLQDFEIQTLQKQYSDKFPGEVLHTLPSRFFEAA